jgi:hypothetical protein
MKIYRPKIVQEIRNYYGEAIRHTAFPQIQEHLTVLANMLYDGILSGNDYLLAEISNYHPLQLGEPIAELKKANLDLTDCHWTIACEYGYKSWEDVLDLRKTEYNRPFEEAIDQLLDGNINELKNIIQSHPNVLTTSSQHGHKATLLHYTASNGVELWRQQVPMNLPEITTYLLSMGVSKWKLMNVYGSQYDTMTLLKSSLHPYKAGIGKEMEALFT